MPNPGGALSCLSFPKERRKSPGFTGRFGSPLARHDFLGKHAYGNHKEAQGQSQPGSPSGGLGSLPDTTVVALVEITSSPRASPSPSRPRPVENH